MPGPGGGSAEIGVQKIAKDGAVLGFVQVSVASLSEPPHQPTAAELATLSSSLYAGYNYTPVAGPAYGVSRVTVSNPDTFTAGIQWLNGRARPVLLSQPALTGNLKLFLFFTGQLQILSMPETYDYEPGDELKLYAIVAASPNSFYAPFNIKSDIHFYFGTAPAA